MWGYAVALRIYDFSKEYKCKCLIITIQLENKSPKNMIIYLNDTNGVAFESGSSVAIGAPVNELIIVGHVTKTPS